MKKKTIATKITFWNWLHQNRLKIVALSFIVIVPIAFILSIYIGSYTNNNKIYFDEQQTAETIVIKNYEKINPNTLEEDEDSYFLIDSFEAFDLYIRWEEINLPVNNPLTGDLDNGNYEFKVYFRSNDDFTVSYVNITPLLQTDWKDIRSLGTSVAIGTGVPVSTNLKVNFNYLMPVKPLPFVTVNTPYLYMKVRYAVMENGSPAEEIVYLQYDLDQINPRFVYPIS